ncbi:MAG: phosphonopyruvate decarboxylase [Chloroflexota bacterium]|nr:MAG: phosphonopyruvate decarboxylase [Chloroflexota bacterium]
MRRWDALIAVADAFPREPIIVTLGGTTRELAALRRSPNHLYVLDSMGLPPAIGLGVALGLEGSSLGKTIVLEGDGSLLMGLSTLATIGLARPSNLILLILDNGTYGATGNQPTASSVVDFARMAEACGIAATEVDDVNGLKSALDWARAADRAVLIRARIDTTVEKAPFLLEDPVVLGATFADYIARNR